MSDISWKRVEPTETEQVGYRTIVTKNFVLPDGTMHTFQTINAEGSISAGCIGLTPEGKVIIVKQFRAGPEKIMYDIPGGAGEVGEDPLHAAQREFLEETGYVSDEWELAGSTHKDAYFNSTWYYYLAKNCRLAEQKPANDETEFIEVCLLTPAEVLSYAKQGKVGDIEALFMVYELLQDMSHAQSN